MSKTLGRRCINVIQLFCVRSEGMKLDEIHLTGQQVIEWAFKK